MMGQKEKNIILVIIMLIVLGYSYYTFYLSGVMIEISEIQKTVETINTNIDNLKAHRQTVDLEIEQAKQKNKVFDASVPDVYDKKVLVLYFYNLIKEKGLDSDNISFSESDKGNKEYNIINISFRVSGSEDSIKSFIKTIENDKRKFVIKQVAMSQGDKGGNSANLSIECYSLK